MATSNTNQAAVGLRLRSILELMLESGCPDRSGIQC